MLVVISVAATSRSVAAAPSGTVMLKDGLSRVLRRSFHHQKLTTAPLVTGVTSHHGSDCVCAHCSPLFPSLHQTTTTTAATKRRMTTGTAHQALTQDLARTRTHSIPASLNQQMLSRRHHQTTSKTFSTLGDSLTTPSAASVTNATATATNALDNGDDEEESNPVMEKLLSNNRRWVQETLSQEPEYFDKLSQIQQPTYLYFGCSDSRIHANEILGLGPGEVFVHRNIANLVPGNDLNALSVLEYAVGHLNIQDIIVTGHYDCGAIRRATSRQDFGMLENWLRQIRDVYRIHKDYLDLIKNKERIHNTLVELNVIEQCMNIYKTGIVQRKRIQKTKELIAEGKNPKQHTNEIVPRIHGLVFNPRDGSVKKLPIDFKRRIGSLDHIYGLY